MSRLFLATEASLNRQVVVKVLPPDLTSQVSTERFKQEIELAAHLQHPNILPVLAAGTRDNLLYYIMPYVPGESLRHRLNREGRLPISHAIRILHEIADALTYAHAQGIVHRDIKPDNILLEGEHAVLTDFGVARALGESRSGGRLTDTGLALGTPGYMAPEQAAGEQIDARADIYALAVVGYEMLAGIPPFAGLSPQALLAAHLTATPRPLRDLRPEVPASVAGVLVRALAKDPNARVRTAAELCDALAPVESDLRVRRTSLRLMLALGAAMVLIFGAAGMLLFRRGAAAPLDPTLLAVAPFRVSGADPSLAYLREGMVDLLAAKLSTGSGLRAADPRAVLVNWRRAADREGDVTASQAAAIAADIGAGRLIQGEVVGTSQHVTINAAVLDAPAGQVRARTSVDGSPDSLPRLVDGLVARLLVLEAGEGDQRLSNLTSTSLPALRAYLDGQALMRRSSFFEAADKFKLALQHDSTFALAGLGLSRAGVWIGQPPDGPGSILAWRHRDKLPARDRALLDVYLGPRWPAPSTFRQRIESAEGFVEVAPGSPEAWYELGDHLYHLGALVDIPDPLRRAAAAFDRAIRLDSSFTLALEHGVTLALGLEDTAGAIEALHRRLRADSTSPWAASAQLVFGLALSDTARYRAAIRSDSIFRELPLVQSAAVAVGIPVHPLDSLFRQWRARAASSQERERVDFWWHLNSVIMGQPSRAAPWPGPEDDPEWLSYIFLEAHLADGDSAAGAATGAALDRFIGTPLNAEGFNLIARYAAGQRALDLGQMKRAEQAVADLVRARIPADSAWLREISTAYALVLQAQLASRRQSPDEARLLAQLDSSMINSTNAALVRVGNLVLARLHERRGDLPRALAVIRRRYFDYPVNPIYVAYHREEGRLAALNGDREGAVRAYRRYLTLRSNPEPRLQPQIAQIRAEIQALQRESTDR
jgi:serine/threonine-protein kinase